jgi:hypothetical protein
MKRFLASLVVLLAFVPFAHSMIFDNRYIPLFQRPLSRHHNRLSNIRIEGAFTTANKAFTPEVFNSSDEEVELFQLNGAYDQMAMTRDTLKVYPNTTIPSSFLPSEIMATNQDIGWKRSGKLETQLFNIRYSQALTQNIIIGIDTLAGHISSHERSRSEYIDKLLQRSLPGQANTLIEGDAALKNFLKILPSDYDTLSWGDTDLSLRLGNRWEYKAKFKAIDAGITLGCIAPTAKARTIFNPASISLGGNKHWGLYISADADFNLKEDWRAILLMRVQKRLARTSVQRMPFGNEPLEYGLLRGPAYINPGYTFIVAPTIILDGIRDNWGINAAYTLVIHQKDSWHDKRKERSIKPNLVRLEELSSWGSEYVTAGLSYDYSRDQEEPRVANRLSCSLDIPLNYAVAHGSVKSYKLSLSMESNF